MTKKRISPYITLKAHESFREIFGKPITGEQFVLNAFPGLYRRAMFDLKGRFSEGELCLILDVFNGLKIQPEMAGQHIIANVGDGCDMNGLDEKWGISKSDLILKLTLSIFHLACLEIWSQKFWTNGQGMNEYVKFLV